MAATARKPKEKASNPVEDSSTIYLPDRDAKIAELAYHKAENRGFTPGYELEDCLRQNRSFCCNNVAQYELRHPVSGYF